MCFSKSKTYVPDTSAQEAELRRQTELLQAQFQQYMAQQQQQFTEQRAADDARYTSQRTADQAEAERQRAMLQEQLDATKAGNADAAARAEALRAEETARSEAKATRSRTYAEGRNSLIDQSTAAVEGAYSGFDDGFFDDHVAKLIAASKPGLDQAYGENSRAARLALADRGNLHSSAAARALGLVQQRHQEDQGALAGSAVSASEELRASLNEQKRQALGGLINSAFVGTENLPDGVTDPGAELSSLSSRVNSYIAGLQQQVGRYIPVAGAGQPATSVPTAAAPAAGGSSFGAPAAGAESKPGSDVRPNQVSSFAAPLESKPYSNVRPDQVAAPVALAPPPAVVPTVTDLAGEQSPVVSSFAPRVITQPRPRVRRDGLTSSFAFERAA